MSLADNGETGREDNLVNFLKKDLHIMKFGLVAKDNNNGTFDINFKMDNMKPFTFHAVRDKTFKTPIKVGDIVEVDFTDVYEMLFLLYQQQKTEEVFKLHSMCNGIITRVIKNYNQQQDDVMFYVDDTGKLFNIHNNEMGTTQLFNDIAQLYTQIANIMLVQLSAVLNSLVPTSATSSALQQYTQELQKLTNKINEFQQDANKILKP